MVYISAYLGLQIRNPLQQFFLRGRHSEEKEATVISTPQSHYAVSGQPSFDMQRRKRFTARLCCRMDCANGRKRINPLPNGTSEIHVFYMCVFHVYEEFLRDEGEWK